MSTNVIELFPTKKALPTIPGIHDLIHNMVDWAEANGVEIYEPEFEHFCVDIMNRLQILAYARAAA